MRTLLIVATAFVALTTTAIAAGGKHSDKLALVAIEQQCGGADLPPADGSPGDETVCRSRLEKAGSHAHVGRVGYVCVYTGTESFGDICTAVADLRHGSLSLTGRLGHTTAESTWAITGGTGAYATANGSVVVKQLSDTKSAVTIHLR
jgi:hypothetical protein